jgi:hypothetical protein
LSRTRQGVSIIPKERFYWLTQQSHHETTLADAMSADLKDKQQA